MRSPCSHPCTSKAFGIAACGGSTDCIYTIPANLSAASDSPVPKRLGHSVYLGAVLVPPPPISGGAAATGPTLFALSVNIANLTVDHDTLFGFRLDADLRSAEVVSTPGRPYGGDVITFALFGSPTERGPTKALRSGAATL